jgi:hypothetical protein
MTVDTVADEFQTSLINSHSVKALFAYTVTLFWLDKNSAYHTEQTILSVIIQLYISVNVSNTK